MSFRINSGVFVDIGANIGKYTILAAQTLGRNGKVISFEPEKYNYSILKRNSELNKLNNVKLVNKGCFSKNALLNFFVDPVNGSGGHSLINQKNNSIKKRISVLALDSYLNKNIQDSIKIIKIDVEGAEVEVLKGAKKTISGVKPDLFIEIDGTDNLLAIKRILFPLGYTMKTFENNNYFFKIQR